MYQTWDLKNITIIKRSVRLLNKLTVYIPNRHNKKDVIILIVISGGTSDPLRPSNGTNKSVTLMANIIVNGRGHNAII